MNIDKNKFIGFFGFGIFVYKAISSISYSFGSFLKDFLIYLDISPSLVFWASEIFDALVFLLLINFIINKIFTNYESISDKILKYFIYSFIIYFVSQLIQIVYPFIQYYFEYDIVNDRITAYYEYLGSKNNLYFVQSTLYYIAEVITVILIYIKIKKCSPQT